MDYTRRVNKLQALFSLELEKCGRVCKNEG
jgi:hypothetical protein